MSEVDELRAVIDDEARLDDLLASWTPKIVAIAHGEARRIGATQLGDEAVGLAWEVVARMIAAERDGSARTKYNWWAHVTMSLRSRVRDLGDTSHLSGASGVFRRGRKIQAYMREHQVGLDQAVAALNESKTRREGSYSQREYADYLALRSGHELAGDHSSAQPSDEISSLMAGPEYGFVLAPFEGRAFIEQVVEHMPGESGHIVKLWLEHVWLEEELTTAQVASRAGCTKAEVSQAIKQAREVARQLLFAPAHEGAL